MSLDIYRREKQLDKLLEKVKNSSEICERNKELIFSFCSECLAQGLTKARTLKLLHQIYKLARMLSKPFDKTNKEDIMKLVRGIESNRGWSEWTKHDYKVAIKKFYKWLKQEDSPEEVKWIRTGFKNSNKILPGELLTQEEIKTLIEAADNVRDKALISVLYESGCRIGELLGLKIKNVQFDEYGAVLIVHGKTGARRVRIISSASLLATWLNNHPFKENPDSPLWIVIGSKNNHEPIGYGGVLTQLRKIAKRAKIRKKVNPHAFRHARATHLANKLTEAQMKEYFGWVQSSDMASIYVHLSGRDVDNALLRMHGLVKDEDKQDEILKLKICERCKEKNSPVSKFCKRCGSPLDLKTILDFEKKRREKDEAVAMVIERLIEKLNLEKVVYDTIKELRLEKKFS
jgi:site-specific recombinase XerD/ribosomal protein L40E